MFLFRIVFSLALFLPASWVFSETEVKTETEMQTSAEPNFFLEVIGSISEVFFSQSDLQDDIQSTLQGCSNYLIDAAESLSRACISDLLEQGADPNTQNDQGETALHILAQNIMYVKNNRFISYHLPNFNFRSKKLLSKDDAELIPKTQNYTFKLDDLGPPYREMVRMLIEADANPNTQNNQGETALHVAVRQAMQAEEEGYFIIGPEQVIPALIELGADPTIPDSQGQTALDRAKTDKVRSLLNI